MISINLCIVCGLDEGLDGKGPISGSDVSLEPEQWGGL